MNLEEDAQGSTTVSKSCLCHFYFFNFFSFIFISWRLINLQYCSDLRTSD